MALSTRRNALSRFTRRRSWDRYPQFFTFFGDADHRLDDVCRRECQIYEGFGLRTAPISPQGRRFPGTRGRCRTSAACTFRALGSKAELSVVGPVAQALSAWPIPAPFFDYRWFSVGWRLPAISVRRGRWLAQASTVGLGTFGYAGFRFAMRASARISLLPSITRAIKRRVLAP